MPPDIIDLTAIQEAIEEKDDIELIHERLDLITALLIKLAQNQDLASNSTSLKESSLH